MKKRIVKSSTNEKRKGAGLLMTLVVALSLLVLALGIYIGYDKIYRVEKDVYSEYIATYNGDNNNVLTLNDKNSKGDYTFTLKINLNSTETTVKGIYFISNGKVSLFMEPYQYKGWSGDYKWKRTFNINKDNNLVYVEEAEQTGINATDMIENGSIFVQK